MVDESRSNQSTWLEGLPQWLKGHNDADDPDVRYHKPTIFRRIVRFLKPGRVSRIHLYEAQDRYLYLRRVLTYQAEAFGPKEKGQVGSTDQKEREITIKICRKILDDASVLLNRGQDDLNFLWREMARVHIMLLEKVFPDKLLPAQLDFFREEARRLAATKDPDVEEMIQRLAEATSDKTHNRQDKDRMLRAIRALIERFTTIRTGRIHQQFVNIRTYRYALLVLVPIALLMMGNKEVLLRLPSGSNAKQQVSSEQHIQPVKMKLIKADAQTPANRPSHTGKSNSSRLQEFFRHPINAISEWLQNNILVFVFFGGLTGGLFSVVNRVRDREMVPGEDAYSLWYVLTKPLIGALGAMILFILFRAGFVSFKLFDALGNGPGAKVFGFAFLAGFSERIAFPKFR